MKVCNICVIDKLETDFEKGNKQCKKCIMIFIMAWRNTWRNKTRSILIMLSVAIGLLAGIGVLSLYKGMMKSRVRTVIDSEVGHLQIHHPGFKKDLIYQNRDVTRDCAGFFIQKSSFS